MLALSSSGYIVSVPFGENARYDLILEDGERLFKVRCKTGRLRDGVVVFRPSSSSAHHASRRQTRRTYTGEIDFFAIFCPETGSVYLVPISDVTTRWMAALRVEPARNSHQRRIRRARDYELSVRIDGIPTRENPIATQAPRGSSGARGSSA